MVGAGGIGVLGQSIKSLVSRERPPLALGAVPESGFSFPSGQATGSSTIILIAAFVLTRWMVTGTGPRIAIWTVASVAIGLIAASRLYLGVHYPTDVVSGVLLGTVWAVVAAPATAVWEEHPRTGTRPGNDDGDTTVLPTTSSAGPAWREG